MHGPRIEGEVYQPELPSGELEITDLNRIYLNKCKLDYRIIKGFWNDAGTFDDMLTVSNLIKKNIK